MLCIFHISVTLIYQNGKVIHIQPLWQVTLGHTKWPGVLTGAAYLTWVDVILDYTTYGKKDIVKTLFIYHPSLWHFMPFLPLLKSCIVFPFSYSLGIKQASSKWELRHLTWKLIAVGSWIPTIFRPYQILKQQNLMKSVILLLTLINLTLVKIIYSVMTQ